MKLNINKYFSENFIESVICKNRYAIIHDLITIDGNWINFDFT